MRRLVLPLLVALALLLAGGALLDGVHAAPQQQQPSPTPRPSATPRATATVEASETITATASEAITATEVITGSVLPEAFAIPPADADSARTLTVIGYGEARAEPNVATLTLGVDTIQDNVSGAVSENNERIEALRAALAALEVPDAAIQTSSFSVYLERPTSGPATTTEALDQGIVYRVTQLLSVRLDGESTTAERISEIIEAAVASGANNVSGPMLGLSGERSLQQEARRAAVLDAYARAQDWATLTGVEITGVASATEAVLSTTPGFGRADGMGGGAISTGTMLYAQQVQVTFYIR